MTDRFVWVANLSDGTTKAEAELTVKGELSPYQKLLAYMKEKALTITGWRFQKGGVTHNAPSASPKARFPSNVPFTLDYRGTYTHARWSSAENTPNGQPSEWKASEDGGYSFSIGQPKAKDMTEWFCRYIVRVQGLKISLWINDATGDSWMQIEKEAP